MMGIAMDNGKRAADLLVPNSRQPTGIRFFSGK
jgi:hypothetical protein